MFKISRFLLLSASVIVISLRPTAWAEDVLSQEAGPRVQHQLSLNMEMSDISKAVKLSQVAYHAYNVNGSPAKQDTLAADIQELKKSGSSVSYLEGETGLGWFKKKSNLAVLTTTSNTLSIGFRGTKDFSDLLTDLNIVRSDFYGFGSAHNGFSSVFESYKAQLFEQTDVAVKNGVNQFELSGHSMGGALAKLTALALKARYLDAGVKVVSFNAPRVGDYELADSFGDLVGHANHARIVKGRDAAASLNFGIFGNKHNGTEIRLDTKGYEPIRKHSFNSFKDGKAEEAFEKYQANPTKIDGFRTSVKKGINRVKEVFNDFGAQAKKTFVSGFQAFRSGVYNFFVG